MTTSPDEPTFPASAVNELMLRIDEINAKDPTTLTQDDLAILVAYHRRARAKRAAGDKPVRTRGTTRSAVPLAELLDLAPTKPKPAPSASPGLIRRF